MINFVTYFDCLKTRDVTMYTRVFAYMLNPRGNTLKCIWYVHCTRIQTHGEFTRSSRTIQLLSKRICNFFVIIFDGRKMRDANFRLTPAPPPTLLHSQKTYTCELKTGRDSPEQPWDVFCRYPGTPCDSFVDRGAIVTVPPYPPPPPPPPSSNGINDSLIIPFFCFPEPKRYPKKVTRANSILLRSPAMCGMVADRKKMFERQ